MKSELFTNAVELAKVLLDDAKRAKLMVGLRHLRQPIAIFAAGIVDPELMPRLKAAHQAQGAEVGALRAQLGAARECFDAANAEAVRLQTMKVVPRCVWCDWRGDYIDGTDGFDEVLLEQVRQHQLECDKSPLGNIISNLHFALKASEADRVQGRDAVHRVGEQLTAAHFELGNRVNHADQIQQLETELETVRASDIGARLMLRQARAGLEAVTQDCDRLKKLKTAELTDKLTDAVKRLKFRELQRLTQDREKMRRAGLAAHNQLAELRDQVDLVTTQRNHWREVASRLAGDTPHAVKVLDKLLDEANSMRADIYTAETHRDAAQEREAKLRAKLEHVEALLEDESACRNRIDVHNNVLLERASRLESFAHKCISLLDAPEPSPDVCSYPDDYVTFLRARIMAARDYLQAHLLNQTTTAPCDTCETVDQNARFICSACSTRQAGIMKELRDKIDWYAAELQHKSEALTSRSQDLVDKQRLFAQLEEDLMKKGRAVVSDREEYRAQAEVWYRKHSEVEAGGNVLRVELIQLRGLLGGYAVQLAPVIAGLPVATRGPLLKKLVEVAKKLADHSQDTSGLEADNNEGSNPNAN